MLTYQTPICFLSAQMTEAGRQAGSAPALPLSVRPPEYYRSGAANQISSDVLFFCPFSGILQKRGDKPEHGAHASLQNILRSLSVMISDLCGLGEHCLKILMNLIIVKQSEG